jgi:hypothetical protein
MGQDIKRFVVAICNPQGDILGTGFMIAPDVVTTCAHVIATEAAPGETVAVKLPDADTLYPAEVLAGNFDFANDVAILKCHAALPETVQPAILGRWQEAMHTPFYSYGYRPLDNYRGNPAEGQLLREVSDITPRPNEPHPTHPVLSLSSQQVNAGMSGAPVYTPATDRVVGMITAIWNSSKRDRDTAFAVSAEAIVAAWPGVAVQLPGEAIQPSANFSKLRPPWELDCEEYREDYELLQKDIALIRQALQESIDPLQKNAYQNRLERLRHDRQRLFQKIKETC